MRFWESNGVVEIQDENGKPIVQWMGFDGIPNAKNIAKHIVDCVNDADFWRAECEKLKEAIEEMLNTSTEFAWAKEDEGKEALAAHAARVEGRGK